MRWGQRDADLISKESIENKFGFVVIHESHQNGAYHFSYLMVYKALPEYLEPDELFFVNLKSKR